MPSRRNAMRAVAAAALGVSLPALPAALRAQETEILKRGLFSGASGHVASGSAAIVVQDGRHYVSLGSDFAFDGAPDPKVALGNDGYDADTILGDLGANEGAQSYAIPDGLDAAAHNEIWLWCEEFDVPLGVANLN